MQELKKALANTGVDQDEIKAYFDEYDKDQSNSIDINEFYQLMESTGAFDEM